MKQSRLRTEGLANIEREALESSPWPVGIAPPS